MDQFTSMVLIIGLPPAAIECLALVWARGRLRLCLAAAVFAVPLLIMGWLIATPGVGDGIARLGFLSLAIVLLGGAIAGAVVGGIIMFIRHLRRSRSSLQD